MKRNSKALEPGEALFIGVDLHKLTWHVTVRTVDVEVWAGSIPGRWEALRLLLNRYRTCKIRLVYEAGCFGFWIWVFAARPSPSSLTFDS